MASTRSGCSDPSTTRASSPGSSYEPAWPALDGVDVLGELCRDHDLAAEGPEAALAARHGHNDRASGWGEEEAEHERRERVADVAEHGKNRPGDGHAPVRDTLRTDHPRLCGSQV